MHDKEFNAIDPNEKTVQIYSDFYAYLRKHGIPIVINYIWIASNSYQQFLTLYTLDSNFKKLPHLMLLNNENLF